MNRLFIPFLLISFILITACSTSFDPEIERENVRLVLEKFIRAWEEKNMATISQIWAHDEDMINFGTDADERWVGWESLKEKYTHMFGAFGKIDFTVSNQSIKISRSGTTAWYSENMDGDFITDGEQVNVRGMRVTGVLEKRNGKWVIVQRHVSMPESGQVVEY